MHSNVLAQNSPVCVFGGEYKYISSIPWSRRSLEAQGEDQKGQAGERDGHVRQGVRSDRQEEERERGPRPEEGGPDAGRGGGEEDEEAEGAREAEDRQGEGDGDRAHEARIADAGGEARERSCEALRGGVGQDGGHREGEQDPREDRRGG